MSVNGKDVCLVFRQDQRTVRALGGRAAMKFYPVARWEIRKSPRGPRFQKALAWHVPVARILAAGVTPLGEAEALGIWSVRSRSRSQRLLPRDAASC